MSRSRLGLSRPAIVLLAALCIPRILVHDLELAGPLVHAVLTVGPPVVWIAVALRAGVPRPLLTLTVVGVAYGVLLALGHQLLWAEVFDDDAPRLGGNLADAPDWVHEAVMRGSVVVSSLVTGTLVGVVAGLIATGLRRVRPARDAR